MQNSKDADYLLEVVAIAFRVKKKKNLGCMQQNVLSIIYYFSHMHSSRQESWIAPYCHREAQSVFTVSIFFISLFQK